MFLLRCSSELRDAAVVMKLTLLVGALVLKADGQASVEEGEFAESLGERVEVEFDRVKDLGVGKESDLGAPALGLASSLEGGERLAPLVRLFPGVALAPNFQVQRLGKGVDDRDAYSVQAAGDFVALRVELAARVQDGHDHFCGGAALLFVHVHRDAASVVGHGHRVVGMNNYIHAVAEARQRLVHRVVHHLPHEMVQPHGARRANVHRGPLAYRLQIAQHLDAGGVVGLRPAWFCRLLLAHVAEQPPD